MRVPEYEELEESPDDFPRARDMTPIAMTPFGLANPASPDTMMAMLTVPTPPPEDPDQVKQDEEDPSKYWVVEGDLEVGYYQITDRNEYLCFSYDQKIGWKQLGVRTNEGDAVDLILDPPE